MLGENQGDIPVNIVIHDINHQYWHDNMVFEILDIMWSINKIVLWLGGGQVAITCVNTENNT